MMVAMSNNECRSFLETAEFRGPILINRACVPDGLQGIGWTKMDDVLSSVIPLEQGRQMPKDAEGRKMARLPVLPNNRNRHDVEDDEQPQQ